jgi:hypothetical protein
MNQVEQMRALILSGTKTITDVLVEQHNIPALTALAVLLKEFTEAQKYLDSEDSFNIHLN